ncbi:unnamed protein product, partial [Polarella glacialis]
MQYMPDVCGFMGYDPTTGLPRYNPYSWNATAMAPMDGRADYQQMGLDGQQMLQDQGQVQQLLQQMQRGQVPPLGNGQKEEQARPVEEDFDEKTAPAGTKAPEAKGAAVNGENRSVWNKVQ